MGSYNYVLLLEHVVLDSLSCRAHLCFPNLKSLSIVTPRKIKKNCFLYQNCLQILSVLKREIEINGIQKHLKLSEENQLKKYSKVVSRSPITSTYDFLRLQRVVLVAQLEKSDLYSSMGSASIMLILKRDGPNIASSWAQHIISKI